MGESLRVPDTTVTVRFEEVTEDSRCPTGTTCIWEGDAAVRIGFTIPNAPPASYVLHTSQRFAQKAEHGGTSVLLVTLVPHPTANGETRRDEYRVTLLIERK